MKGLLLTVLLAASAAAQPQAPQLALGADGRFEFAPVPEVALVRGVAETVQLGPFQIDPTNRWTAGDLTRQSGWTSLWPTRLVDAASGDVVPTAALAYDALTAELKYAGVWSGDWTVRLETTNGEFKSAPFRIRVLTPTVVYGDNAVAINEQKKWGAATCTPPLTFADCRSRFKGGITDVAPLVVFFSPGRYPPQSWYLGARRFQYILGDAGNRAWLSGGTLSTSNFERFVIANLNLDNTNIANTKASANWPGTMNVSRVYQCCETAYQNGIVNPNKRTVTRQTVELWNWESLGMGSKGNAHHPVYLEMRPDSRLLVNNLRIMGSNGCSGIKTTMADVQVRHTLFNVSRKYDEPDIGEEAGGQLMHTPLDVTSVSDLIAYGNHFRLWQQPTVGTPNGYFGNLTGAIFLRLRQAMHGSDKPAYPSVSWNPPVGALGTPPGGDWSSAAATFVNDAFWRDVKSRPITEPTNIFSFKHFIGFNTFEQLTSSPRNVAALRDDGTYPLRTPSQFATSNIAERVTPGWIERSMNFLVGNTYVGYPEGAVLFQLDKSQYTTTPEPGSKWPRTPPDELPHMVELEDLPPWFKL